MTINDDIKLIFNKCSTKKVIATTNQEGTLHVTFKNMLFINNEGNIVLFEILERSITNRNLVYSIWFNKTIAINALSEEGVSFHIQAIPIRAIVSGKEFEQYYEELQNKMGDIDLSTVWLFKILNVEEKTLKKRIKDDESNYPFINHLDRITK